MATVGELVEKLQRLPQDQEVRVITSKGGSLRITGVISYALDENGRKDHLAITTEPYGVRVKKERK